MQSRSTPGNPVNTIVTVATPQRRWIGLARMDWQLGPKNTFITSYSADVNHLTNLGVGGTTLPEAGYDSQQYEHMLRFTNVTTVSPKLMHEARVSLRWDGETDTPTPPLRRSASPAPSPAAAQPSDRSASASSCIEADDDAILNTKNHLLKFGTQFFIDDEHRALTTNFNGSYTFGGGIAPVLDASNQPIPARPQIITGLEQYRRALLNLARRRAHRLQQRRRHAHSRLHAVFRFALLPGRLEGAAQRASRPGHALLPAEQPHRAQRRNAALRRQLDTGQESHMESARAHRHVHRPLRHQHANLS